MKKNELWDDNRFTAEFSQLYQSRAEKVLGRILPDSTRFLKGIPWPAAGRREFQADGAQRG
jgi:hypothetical protein